MLPEDRQVPHGKSLLHEFVGDWCERPRAHMNLEGLALSSMGRDRGWVAAFRPAYRGLLSAFVAKLWERRLRLERDLLDSICGRKVITKQMEV